MWVQSFTSSFINRMNAKHSQSTKRCYDFKQRFDLWYETLYHSSSCIPLSHLAWCYSCTFLSSYIGNISASFASDVLFISFVCKLWYFKIFQYSVFKVQCTDFHPCDWAWEDSNFRPHAYQACALTGWATSPWIRQPPALPYRLQHSTIGRLGLNHRVRDENGCVP